MTVSHDQRPRCGGHAAFQRAMGALAAGDVPFLAGGALALEAYAGVRRDTKDLDVFVLPGDLRRALDVLAGAGFRTELPFPHWLGKAHAAEWFVDVIFSSGNGAAPVDEEWFTYATPSVAFGVPVRLCPPEETIWSKAFVMERERFDGADVAHLLLGRGATLDWARLLRRFDDHWRVLLAHLVLFQYVYPDAGGCVPAWVLDDLFARARRDMLDPKDAQCPKLCRGTLLSREQYLSDIAAGRVDARLALGTMSVDDIATWTDAIHQR